MKIKDFLLIKIFLNNETLLSDNEKYDILNKQISILFSGENDSIVERNNVIIYHNPTSVSNFLFHVLFHLFGSNIDDIKEKDLFTLSLMFYCNQYIYHDLPKNHTHNKIPSIKIDGEKISISSFIIKSIVEPLVQKINFKKMLVTDCKFTDTCRISENDNETQLIYELNKSLRYDVPIIIYNNFINNEAAKMAHLTLTQIESEIGEEKTSKIVSNLLFDDKNLFNYIVTILKYLNGDHIFIIDFLQYMQSYVILPNDAHKQITNINFEKLSSDNYLNSLIKMSSDNYSPSITNQWTQWSMMMGLIEKQLGPMRGSMWPTTETMKKHDVLLREKLKNKTKTNGTAQLNMEEMLEVMRDLYDHNATEPGKVTETLLKTKGKRIWN